MQNQQQEDVGDGVLQRLMLVQSGVDKQTGQAEFMNDQFGRPTQAFYNHCQQVVEMNVDQKIQPLKQAMIAKTLSRLLANGVIDKLNLLQQKDLMVELSNTSTILHLNQMQQVPLKRDGMFICLSGGVCLRYPDSSTRNSHKKLTQQSSSSSDSLISPILSVHEDLKNELSEAEVPDDSPDKFSYKPKLQIAPPQQEPEINTVKAPLHEIEQNTSLIAPLLNMRLKSNDNHLNSIVYQLHNEEQQMLNHIIKEEKVITPGMALNQFKIIQSSQKYEWSSKYEFTASAEMFTTTFLFLSRKNFIKALRTVNQREIVFYSDYLIELIPSFQTLSKSLRMKICRNSRIIGFPNGWRQSKNMTAFHLILNGSFHLKSGRAAEDQPKSSQAQLVLKSDTVGILKNYVRNNHLTNSQRLAVKIKAEKDTQMTRNALKNRITSQRKEVVLAKGHYFNEEKTYYEVREPIEMQHGFKEWYEVGCYTNGATCLVIDKEELAQNIKYSPQVLDSMFKSYQSKLPNLKDDIPEFVKTKQFHYPSQTNESLLVPKSLRHTIDQTVVETRQLYAELINELPQLDKHKRSFKLTLPSMGLPDALSTTRTSPQGNSIFTSPDRECRKQMFLLDQRLPQAITPQVSKKMYLSSKIDGVIGILDRITSAKSNVVLDPVKGIQHYNERPDSNLSVNRSLVAQRQLSTARAIPQLDYNKIKHIPQAHLCYSPSSTNRHQKSGHSSNMIRSWLRADSSVMQNNVLHDWDSQQLPF